MASSHNQFLLFALLSAFLLGGANGANILGLFTGLSPSHLVIQMSMAKILAENGHNVTVVTALKPPLSHKDINHIQVPLSESDQQLMSSTVADMAKKDNRNVLLFMLRMIQQMSQVFNKMADIMKDQTVRNLYENTDNKFDLVIVGFFMNKYQMAIAQKLKVPLIVQICNPPIQFVGNMLGNPPEVSYVPSQNIAVEKDQIMNFRQRLTNYLSSWGTSAFVWLLETRNEKIYNELYGDDPSLSSYADISKNISLIFFASHAPSEGPIRPNVPAVIEVGGIQIKDQPDPLPKNMADFLSQATHGAILLSLGSNLKGSHIKPETVQKMFNVLSKLKLRVIWKWEDMEHTPGKSSNILYSKWLPQDDILAHPKIKLFITHAGKGGLTEAQYHGKPMLALPVFGDQPGNAEVMVKQGFGLSLELLALEEQTFHEAIQEVLENPKYAQAVGSFSTLYRDRPLTARETFIYWTEYVIRHHGAKHLQSPVVQMSYIAANNLDIYALLISLVLISLYVMKLLISFICGKCKAKSSKVGKSKVKKN